MTDASLDRPVTPTLLLREVGVSVFFLCVLLGSVEWALRTETAFAFLPLPKPYYSYDVTRRLRYLDTLQSNGPVDVLFVGSSVVRAAIDPTRFDAVLRQRTGLHVTSFNGGLSKMAPAGASYYLERLWLPRARPRFVVHGIRDTELSSRTKVPSMFEFGLVEPLWLENTPRANLRASILQKVALLQYRGTLAKALERLRDGTPLHILELGELPTDRRGYRREPEERRGVKARRSTEEWRNAEKPRKGRFTNALRFLEAMRVSCRANGAIYVLANIPEHANRFASGHGPEAFANYHRRVRSWARARGVPFLDPANAKLEPFADDRYFSDYTHMSPSGSALLTASLAELFAPIYTPRTSSP